MKPLNLVRYTVREEQLLQAFSYALALVSEMPGRYTHDSASMSLPISTTTNCELFKTPALFDDNAYIAANG